MLSLTHSFTHTKTNSLHCLCLCVLACRNLNSSDYAMQQQTPLLSLNKIYGHTKNNGQYSPFERMSLQGHLQGGKATKYQQQSSHEAIVTPYRMTTTTTTEDEPSASAYKHPETSITADNSNCISGFSTVKERAAMFEGGAIRRSNSSSSSSSSSSRSVTIIPTQ